MKKRWITGTRGLGLGLGALALVAAGCASDGDDGKDGADAPTLPYFLGLSTAPPSGPAGQYTIDTSGGAGVAGNGGAGGDVGLEINDGSLGGNILVFATGVADAGFDLPAVTTTLGTNPLEVTLTGADTGGNVVLAVMDAEPDAGTPYLVDGNRRIYVSDGNGVLGDEDPVTGLEISAEVILTLELNYGSTRARIDLDNAVVNRGTLTTALTGGGDRGELEVNCDTYYGAAGSRIDLTGPDGDGGPGRNGGWLNLKANDGDWGPTENAGSIVNLGAIDTSGGDGTAGGDAGSIYLYANLWAVNTGSLTARGGAGTAGPGGDGDYIEIDAEYGNNYNSGAWDASGGDGTTAGGSGGDPYLYIGYPGDIRNSGNLVADGGDVTDADCEVGEGATCAGGHAGDIGFYVYGGDIVSSGDLSARGGDGTAGAGGMGGDLSVGSDYDDGWEGEYQPVGDMLFSGDIDLGGGGGATGGMGGDVDFELDAESAPTQQQIVLYGYTRITTDGGDSGEGEGGQAGDFSALQDNANTDGMFDRGPSGAVVNYAAVSARGGAGITGGRGGAVVLETEEDAGYLTGAAVAYNFGDLDLRGGAGDGTGGGSGGLYIWGYNAAGNDGAVDASGGDATGDADTEGAPGAGDAGEVGILSQAGPVTNRGAIAADGGDATGSGTTYGGRAGAIALVGTAVVNSAALSAAGGAGAWGGPGAQVFLYGLFDGTTNTASTFDVAGGAGSEIAGADGSVYVDGMNVTGEYLAGATE